MYLQIKTIDQEKAKYGNNLIISRIGLYEDNGKYVKRIKLDEMTCEMLTTMPI